MAARLSRRSLIAGATAVGSSIVHPLQAAEHTFVQYHNQPAGGTLNRNLVAMWDAVRNETNGRVVVTVVPVAEAQQVPFAFASARDAHKAIDGPFGSYIGQEMATKGIHLFAVAGF